MKFNQLIFIGLTVLLSSCASTESFYDTNGKETKVVTCSIYAKDSCKREAGSICKSNGYKLIRNTWPSPYISGLHFQCNNEGTISRDKPITSKEISVTEKLDVVDRKLTDFDRLQLDLSANVTITVGKELKITIAAEGRISPLILTETSGSALRIYSDESYNTSKEININIQTPFLNEVQLNGSGDISILGLSNRKIKLTITGSGDIRASGVTDVLVAHIQGSGDINTSNLKARKAIVKISGSGDANISVKDELIAEIKGSGDISYRGTPHKLQSSITGSGNISN